MVVVVSQGGGWGMTWGACSRAPSPGGGGGQLSELGKLFPRLGGRAGSRLPPPSCPTWQVPLVSEAQRWPESLEASGTRRGGCRLAVP